MWRPANRGHCVLFYVHHQIKSAASTPIFAKRLSFFPKQPSHTLTEATHTLLDYCGFKDHHRWSLTIFSNTMSLTPTTAPSVYAQDRRFLVAVSKYCWLEANADGYYCTLCRRHYNTGEWVSSPMDNVQRLDEKAERHHVSVAHRRATI